MQKALSANDLYAYLLIIKRSRCPMVMYLPYIFYFFFFCEPILKRLARRQGEVCQDIRPVAFDVGLRVLLPARIVDS